MQRDYNNYMRMAGSEISAQTIKSILKLDDKILSGILGVNDKLEIISQNFSNQRLKMFQFGPNIDKICQSHVTGIIAFDNFAGTIFVSDSRLISRLKRVCESAGLTLIDVMLFGSDDWVSLRCQNRL